MLRKELNLSLSSLLTSHGAVDFPTTFSPQNFFSQGVFFFSNVFSFIHSSKRWLVVQALFQEKTQSRTVMYKLDACPNLGLVTPELLVSKPNHFYVVWASISFSVERGRNKTTVLKTTQQVTFIQITCKIHLKYRFLGLIADSFT